MRGGTGDGVSRRRRGAARGRVSVAAGLCQNCPKHLVVDWLEVYRSSKSRFPKLLKTEGTDRIRARRANRDVLHGEGLETIHGYERMGYPTFAYDPSSDTFTPAASNPSFARPCHGVAQVEVVPCGLRRSHGRAGAGSSQGAGSGRYSRPGSARDSPGAPARPSRTRRQARPSSQRGPATGRKR